MDKISFYNIACSQQIVRRVSLPPHTHMQRSISTANMSPCCCTPAHACCFPCVHRPPFQHSISTHLGVSRGTVENYLARLGVFDSEAARQRVELTACRADPLRPASSTRCALPALSLFFAPLLVYTHMDLFGTLLSCESTCCGTLLSSE